MSNRPGFILIELLVLIAIIALLMAILMPALKQAKEQAKAVICQSNLHQWGSIFLMYTDDNNGRFLAGSARPSDWPEWMKNFKDY